MWATCSLNFFCTTVAMAYMLRTILCTDVTSRLGMGFSFYPLRRQFRYVYFRSRQPDYVRSFFEIGNMDGMQPGVLDWLIVGNLPPSRLRTFSFPQRLNFSSFLSPSSWRSFFGFFTNTTPSPNLSSLSSFTRQSSAALSLSFPIRRHKATCSVYISRD